MIDTIIKYAIIAAIVGALVATCIALWESYIAEPYRIQGDVRTTTKLQPQINALSKRLTDAQAVNTGLQGQFAALQKSFADYAQERIDAEVRAKAALAAETARADANAVERGRLTAILVRPKSTESTEIVCARATSILHDAVDLLR